MHTYAAMSICADESIFATYYSNDLKKFYTRKFLNQEFITPNFCYSKVIKKHEKIDTNYGFSSHNNNNNVCFLYKLIY